MEKYIMTLDQGTTSSRCILYDRSGRIISIAQKEFRQIYPQAGWVEHDAEEIWQTQLKVAQEALQKAGCTYQQIEAIGITNQRETTVVWDRLTGMPIYNAIVWQCRRTAEACDALKERGFFETIKKKTGLVIDAYFSATKLSWILDNVNGARARAERGELLFGTIETWLIWKLTKGKVHITDYSNASRTMLFNIHDICWDEKILALLNIPGKMLPTPVPSSAVYGYTAEQFFGGAIKIAGAAGDQQAALFGQACFQEGEAKNTYGTGCFLLMNTGNKPVYSESGLVSTIAWGIDDKITYALEGSVFIAGAAVQWLRDELSIIDDAPQSEQLAYAVEDTGGVYFVPAFVGLGAPHWDQHARGALFGITRGTDRRHIARAALESIAYQTYDLIKAMEYDAAIALSELKVDGGAVSNDFLMRFQADILGKKVIRPQVIEVTSLGAAYLAGLACGYWQSIEDIVNNQKVDRIFTPEMNQHSVQHLIEGWRKAVDTTRSFKR